MKLNRFSMLLATALALVSTSAFAQDTKPGKGGDAKPGQEGGKGQRRGGAMNPKALEKELGLTTEQMDKLKPAFKTMTDERKKMADVTDPKEKRTKMMELTKNLMKSVEDVLTPEQKKKFEEMKKAATAGAKKKKKDGGN
jgi:Spy/CpxP family protein refolding chaperone